MTSSKSLLVQLVWTTLICGRVLVFCKPQSSRNSGLVSKSEQEHNRVEQNSLPLGAALGKTKGFEIKHGYSFNIANAPDGTPFSHGWAYIGGRAGPGPTYYKDATGFAPSEMWSGRAIDMASSTLYTVAGAVAFGAILSTLAPFFTSFTRSAPVAPAPVKKGNTGSKAPEIKKEEEKVKSTSKDENKEANEPKESTKSRRRRDLAKTQVQNDTDLTRLASIVLNAIHSGECLQKTICQVGTGIGESPKGRLIGTLLLGTLLPPSVHANHYFVTMKKALRGETICEKFDCHYQTYQ